MIRKTIMTIGLTASLSGMALASSGVGVINIDKIYKAYGQTKVNNIQKHYQAKMNVISKELSKLQKEDSSTKDKKSHSYQSRQTHEKALEKELNNYYTDMRHDMGQAQKTFMNNLKAASKEVAMKYHYSVIIPSQATIYVDNMHSVTTQVMHEMKGSVAINI